RRVELGGEEAAGARKLLRQRAGQPLGLEETATVERTPCGARDLAGELEIVANERARLVEQNDDEHAVGAGDRDGQERGVRRTAPDVFEPLVVGQVRSCD